MEADIGDAGTYNLDSTLLVNHALLEQVHNGKVQI